MVFEFYELKYVENVYLKLNMVQSTKQEAPEPMLGYIIILIFRLCILSFFNYIE